METIKLTDRQQEVLNLVKAAIENTGAPPTRAEIAAELGFKSANAAEEHWPEKASLNSSAAPLAASV
jgi:repressor LexA